MAEQLDLANWHHGAPASNHLFGQFTDFRFLLNIEPPFADWKLVENARRATRFDRPRGRRCIAGSFTESSWNIEVHNRCPSVSIHELGRHRCTRAKAGRLTGS